MLRAEDPPDDLLVVVRATPGDRQLAEIKIAEDAAASALVYVVTDGAEQVILHGVSVFAWRDGVDAAEVLRRVPFAPSCGAVTVGALRVAGFPVLPTGANPDHFDVQLVARRSPADGPADAERLADAARRLLEVAGDLRPNPAYAGDQEAP